MRSLSGILRRRTNQRMPLQEPKRYMRKMDIMFWPQNPKAKTIYSGDASTILKV